MKLIIDISEDLYKWIKDEYDNPNEEVAYSAIANGTPYEEPKKNCFGCQGDKDFGCEDCLNKPKGDCISRKQVLDELLAHQYSQDFCKEHGIEYSIHSGMVRIIVNRAPTVEPESPHSDLISRSALKKEFDKHCVGQCNECHYCGEGGDCTIIDNAPTVESDMEDNKFLREDKE